MSSNSIKITWINGNMSKSVDLLNQRGLSYPEFRGKQMEESYYSVSIVSPVTSEWITANGRLYHLKGACEDRRAKRNV